MTRIEMVEKICKLYGAEFDGTTVAGLNINNEYFISIVGCHPNNIHVNLMKKENNEVIRVAYEAINVGASDKVIMNRYNKLVSKI